MERMVDDAKEVIDKLTGMDALSAERKLDLILKAAIADEIAALREDLHKIRRVLEK